MLCVLGFSLTLSLPPPLFLFFPLFFLAVPIFGPGPGYKIFRFIKTQQTAPRRSPQLTAHSSHPPLRWGSRWWFACCVDLVSQSVEATHVARGWGRRYEGCSTWAWLRLNQGQGHTSVGTPGAVRETVKSSQGLLFSEARKPYVESAGHGRRGWCAQVWSPPPPGLSKESGER